MKTTVIPTARQYRQTTQALLALTTRAKITAISAAELVSDPAGGPARDLACDVDLRAGRITARVRYGMHVPGNGPAQPGVRYLPEGLTSAAPLTVCELHIGRARIRACNPALTGPLWHSLADEISRRLRDTGQPIDTVLATAIDRHDPDARPLHVVAAPAAPVAATPMATVTNLEVARRRRQPRPGFDNQPA